MGDSYMKCIKRIVLRIHVSKGVLNVLSNEILKINFIYFLRFGHE